ncbi:MAG: metallopeptidase TldD-related protein [Alphaproteobacteria bacterium]
MARSDAELVSLGEHALALAKRGGASAADVLVLEATEMTASIRHGAPETIERAESCGLGLRVFAGKGSATLSTSDLGKDAIAALAEQAIAIARAAPEDPFAALADPSLLAKTTPELDLADAAEPSMEALQQSAREAEAAGLAAKGIANSEGADASYGYHRVALLTSTGFAGSYAATRSALSLSLIAGSGERMQRDYDYAVATHRADLESPQHVGGEAARRTVTRLNPRKIASQTATVFFEPRVARSLLSALAGAISGSAIARGTSFLKGELGKKLFADGIRITDDPLRKRGLASQPWDGEGVVAERREFIEDGVLTSWLLDTRSANQLKLKTTGHAARGLAGAPHPSPSNLYLAAGKETPDTLYKSVKSGLLVTETIGHGVNLITGDYSVGASGFWLEGGQITYPVSEITIAANLRDIFASLVPADDLAFRYQTNAPTIMVPRMTVAGN